MDQQARERWATGYLGERGLDFDRIREVIGPIESEACAIIIGSTARGYANSMSDVDVMLLGARTWRSPDDSMTLDRQFADVLHRLPSGQEINVELWPPNALDGLGDKMRRCRAVMLSPDDVSSLPSLHEMEYRLLHSVRFGIPLINPDRLASIRDDLLTEELHYHAIVRGLVIHYALRENVISQALDGDDRTTFWMLRKASLAMLSAVLGSCGESDHRDSWILKHLEEQRPVLGDASCERYLEHLLHWPRGDRVEVVREAIGFWDEEVRTAIARQPVLLPLLLRLGQGIGVVQSLPPKPEMAAAG